MVEGKYVIEIVVTGPNNKKVAVKVEATESTYLESLLAATRAIDDKVNELYGSSKEDVV